MNGRKQIFNPYLPSYEYIPDGEPHVFDGRLYIYGSHDRFGGDDYCLNDYVCWSAPTNDLSDWRYEGIIYRKSQHPYHIGRNLLFAPDVTRGKDGRYYLYYSVADSAVLSVAVCDEPAGQYTYYGDVHDSSGHVAGSAKGDFFQFDPGIFIDDDGRIFLYSGFCPGKREDTLGRRYVGCHMCELEDDMLTIRRDPKIVIDRDVPCPEEQRYFEAPSMRKYNGKYYLIYSVRNGGLHYYISEHPDRDFLYGGRIHSTSDVGLSGHDAQNPAYPNGNTHGSLVEIHGKYYIFDHRMTNNSSYCRQGVAEEVFILPDGNIQQAEATSCGLNGGPLRGIGRYPAYIACALMDHNDNHTTDGKKSMAPCITQEGNDRESEPGQFLQNMINQCVVGYKYFDFHNTSRILLTIRGDAKGLLIIRYAEDGPETARVEILSHGDDWHKVEGKLPPGSEKSALYMEYLGEGRFDLLEFEFSSSSANLFSTTINNPPIHDRIFHNAL